MNEVESTRPEWLTAFGCYRERVALHSASGRVVTYHDLLSFSQLLTKGLEPKRLVVCLVENSADSLLGYLALLSIGQPILVLPAKVSKDYLNQIEQSYRPGYYFVHSEALASYGLDNVDRVIECGQFSIVGTANAHYPVHDALALLLPTSGSTGSPKFVRLSHSNIIENALSIIKYLDIQDADCAVTTLPSSYSYGLSVVHSHILQGAQVAATDFSILDREFWKFALEVGVTSFGIVPFQYDLLRRLSLRRSDLPRLRYVTQAGGALNVKAMLTLNSTLAQLGAQLIPMYGQTEASPRISFLSSKDVERKPDSIGKAIPGGSMWLEDDEGTIVSEAGKSGELIYRGPNVAMGYASGHEDLVQGDHWNGVLRTGDIARFDEEGDFYIVGRKSRFTKLFGHRVNLDDVERHVCALITDVACQGHGDILAVFIEEQNLGFANNVRDSIASYLSVTKHAVHVYSVEQFLRGDRGKILYSELFSSNPSRQL